MACWLALSLCPARTEGRRPLCPRPPSVGRWPARIQSESFGPLRVRRTRDWGIVLENESLAFWTADKERTAAVAELTVRADSLAAAGKLSDARRGYRDAVGRLGTAPPYAPTARPSVVSWFRSQRMTPSVCRPEMRHCAHWSVGFRAFVSALVVYVRAVAGTGDTDRQTEAEARYWCDRL